MPPDNRARDLSWYDWSVVKDISADGQWVLFEESGEPFAGRYAVSVRRLTDAPIHLGDGSAGGLSPDGKWALDVPPPILHASRCYRSVPAHRAMCPSVDSSTCRTGRLDSWQTAGTSS